MSHELKLIVEKNVNPFADEPHVIRCEGVEHDEIAALKTKIGELEREKQAALDHVKVLQKRIHNVRRAANGTPATP